MGVRRIDAFGEAQLDDLMRLYRGEWWSKDRRPDDVRRMLAHTDECIAFADEESGALVAFARVLTDSIYKALVFDVIVAPAHRGQGLGEMLMRAIVEHPRLADVEHLELYCLPELVPFYRKWGFTHELGALRFMRRQRP